MDFDREAWYEASTMTITQKNVGLLGLKKNRDIEYYYEMLREKKPEQNLDGQNETGEENPDGKNENLSDSQSGMEKEDSHEENCSFNEGDSDAAYADECKSNIAKIASELWSCDDKQEENKIDCFMEENSNLAGTLPKDIERQLSLLSQRKSRIPSCVKLLEYFKSVRKKNNYILTRMRPSRRFGYTQMGKIRRATPGKILAALDVSGSINESQIIQFYTALENVFNSCIKDIEIFQFDTNLKTDKPLPFKKKSLVNIRGRGGTSFQPIFDYIIKNQKNYDSLIIFTDGYADEPCIHHRLSAKVLWVLPDNNCYYTNQKMLSKSGFVTVLV